MSMSDPKHISDPLAQILLVAVHPAIIEADAREAAGEDIDWEKVFAACEDGREQAVA